jgi:hypothetical protein
VVAVGFGGSAGIEAARTEVDRAPVVVGIPLKSPWDVAPRKLATTGGAGAANETDANARTLAASKDLGDMVKVTLEKGKRDDYSRSFLARAKTTYKRTRESGIGHHDSAGNVEARS